MAEVKSNIAQYIFNISGKELLVVKFSVNERISSPYEIDLTLISEDQIDFNEVLGKEALLVILGEEENRYFHGIILEFIQTGSRGRYIIYQTRVVPSLWLLSLAQGCRIFQNKNVQDIVKQVLTESGIISDRFSFRLTSTYNPREYCVQYRETNLNFISRLLEEEGIFYFFEHTEDKHLMVFGDSSLSYKPIIGNPDIPFHPIDAMVPEEETVHDFIFSRQIKSGKVTLKDFYFEKPSLDLKAQMEGDSYQKLEIYDYPGIYTDNETGSHLAQIRLQEATTFKDKAKGKSVCPRFIPGFTFTLSDHDREDFNQEYLIVEALHKGSQPQVLEEMLMPDLKFSYSNEFTAIPSSVKYRPPRKTPKPFVKGAQTAIVVGPQGEEIYTDEHGRVKVQFHWDLEGKQDDKSSCWIRVSHAWAGAGWGAMYIPRIGHEVIVDFLEGDPDRPIITGRVYHGTNKPPYGLPGDKTKSTLMSNSSIGGGGLNELRFEDKKGEEEIYIHAQKDENTVVENDQGISVGNDRSESIVRDRHLMVGRNKTEKVKQNKTIEVTGAHNETIGAGMSITIGSTLTENVLVNYAETVGGAMEVTVGGAIAITAGAAMAETVGAIKTEAVGGSKSENIGSGKSLNIGKDLNETIGNNKIVKVNKNLKEEIKEQHEETVGKEYILKAKKMQLVAKDEILIKSGKAEIVMKKNGNITIKGNKINIKGSGDVIIKGSKIKEN